jgi:Transposase zinc-binding domain
VQQHAATFFAQAEAEAGADMPQFVKDEFDAFLECGILAHGFLRLRRGDCGHDKLVDFSCKRARILPIVRGPARGADCSSPDGSRHRARAGAPAGAFSAEPAALAAGRATQAADARAAGGAPRDHAQHSSPPAGSEHKSPSPRYDRKNKLAVSIELSDF